MAQSDAAASSETIVVTGSRIARADYTSSSPVTTVSAETIQLTQTLSLETLLNDMPQIIPGNNLSSNNSGGEAFATLDLRGLGTARTLILVDGTRLPPSSTSGTVSIDNIPAGLISRIEVVTGGASTVYGSDAVSGVVNFILKDDYEGGEVSYQYSIGEDGKAPTHGLDFMLGGNFDAGNGNAVLFGSYYSRSGVFQSEYDYSEHAAAIYYYADAAGLHDVLVSTPAEYHAAVAQYGPLTTAFSGGSATPPWGVVNNDATNPFQNLDILLPGQFAAADMDCDAATPGVARSSGSLSFNSAGVLTPQFATGSTACSLSTRSDNPNGTTSRYNYAPDNYIVIPAERFNFGFISNYDLANGVTMRTNIMYTDISNSVSLAATPATGLTVSASNSYIPADLAIALGSRADPGADFIMNRRFTDVGLRTSVYTNRALMATLAFEGDFNENWSWDAAAIFSRVSAQTDSRNSVNATALTQGLTGCPLVGALPGCVELNIFGENTLTAEMASFVRTDTRELEASERSHFTFFVNGDLMQLPAGPLAVAAGVEYREDSASRVVDDAQRNGDIFGFNAVQDISGSVRVAEIYAEASVPLVTGRRFFDYLGLEGGYRLSEYNSGAGTVTSYKFGGEWAPIDWLRFRAMYNTATRAPSAFELFQNGDQGFPAFTDPCNDTPARTAAVAAFCVAQGVPAAAITGFNQSNTQVEALAFGQPDLAPETAETYTVGFVVQPPIPFGDLSVTVDYYDIEIEDVISTRGVGTILGSCYTSLNPASTDCLRVTRRTDNGQIDNINTGRQNSGTLATSGVDVQIDFGMDVTLPAGLSGRLGISNLFNHLESFDDGIEEKGLTYGQIGSAFPEYKNTMTVTYMVDAVTGQLRWTHVPEMTDGWFGIDTFSQAPAADYLDASVRWSMTESLDLTLGVRNLLAETPPLTIGGIIGGQGNIDPQVYRSMEARQWTISARARF